MSRSSEAATREVVDAERALLATVFAEPALMESVEGLHPEDFVEARHGLIWRVLVKLKGEKRLKPCDEFLLEATLRAEGVTVDEALSSSIMAITSTLPSRHLLLEHAKAIRSAVWTRTVTRLLKLGLEDATAGRDVESLLGRIEAIKSAATGAREWIGSSNGTISSAKELIDRHPTLEVPVVDGLIRQGETMNLIAPPKVGKSWLAHQLALCVATGTPWLGFPVFQGDVLLIDNELHPSVLAYRLSKVAEEMQLPPHWAEHVHAWTLRGKLQSLQSIAGSPPHGSYRLIILDALYRFVPSDRSENDNSMMANLYNAIDGIASASKASIAVVHHSNRGDQSGKVVTDVGAGAGAQSRAADAHIVLRPHEEDGVYVVDGAIRSFAPVQPFCLRWNFPLFRRDDSLDPELLRQPKRRIEEDEPKQRRPKPADWPPERFASTFISSKPRTKAEVLLLTSNAGLSDTLAESALNKSIAARLVFRWHLGGNRPGFATVPQRDTPPLPSTHADPQPA